MRTEREKFQYIVFKTWVRNAGIVDCEVHLKYSTWMKHLKLSVYVCEFLCMKVLQNAHGKRELEVTWA